MTSGGSLERRDGPESADEAKAAQDGDYRKWHANKKAGEVAVLGTDVSAPNRRGRNSAFSSFPHRPTLSHRRCTLQDITANEETPITPAFPTIRPPISSKHRFPKISGAAVFPIYQYRASPCACASAAMSPSFRSFLRRSHNAPAFLSNGGINRKISWCDHHRSRKRRCTWLRQRTSQ